MQRSTTLGWLAGFVLGSAAAWLVGSTFGLALVALVAVPTVAPRPNAAYAGGLLLAVGAWWLYLDRQMTERCLAANGPNGSCQVIADPSLPVLFLVLGVGALLTAIAVGSEVMRHRAGRGAR